MFQALFRCSWVVVVLSCFTSAQQEFLNFPPLPYHHGNTFYQQQNYQPSFPPHFRPFGFHQQDYQSPYKPVNYQTFFTNQQQEPTQFQNNLPLRGHLSSPFAFDYPNFYQQFGQPQYDETYQDLNEFNGIIPSVRGPIQLIPSRFPQRVENIVEKIQNRFSIYNPGLVLPNTLPQLEGVNNATTAPAAAQEGTTAPDSEVISTESSASSSTDSPAAESETEASEDTTVRQSLKEEDATPLPETQDEPSGSSEPKDETEPEPVTEENKEEQSTESSTETTEDSS